LGKKLGKDLKVVAEEIKKLSEEQIKATLSSGSINIRDHTILVEELNVTLLFQVNATFPLMPKFILIPRSSERLKRQERL